jgi:excisionase family DNA binding protein
MGTDDRAPTHSVARETIPSSASPWMNPDEAAAYLRIAIGTLRNWTSAKYVPHCKRGRVVRYHRDLLDQWLSRGSCTGRSKIANDPRSRVGSAR